MTEPPKIKQTAIAEAGPSLAQIAGRVLNRPLLLHPDKADLILHVLQGRIGIEPLQTVTPETNRFVGTYRRDNGGVGSMRVENGVAILPIVGSLVNRGAWIGASSGLVSYEGIAAQLREAEVDQDVRAILLDIDSPGGEATGMFAAAKLVSAVNKSKPVVAFVNDVAASAAYGIASAASEIIVSPTSMVGSIGVVLTHLDRSGELEDRGVKPTLIHAGAHKVDGHPFGPDHGKLAQLGINAPDVSKLISAKIGGEIATKYSIEDRKVDILVTTIEKQRDSIADIGQMFVNPGASPSIPLEAVADISMSIGPSEITRIGQERVAVVSANLNFGDLNEAVLAVQQHIDSLTLPLNMLAKVAGQSEEMENSFQSLQFALALAIFLVYLVMASQFESLLHPLLILFTVPLACAGSIYGLYVSGTNISVVVFIGLIMLAGIVVNNAIVLIDRINQLRASGLEKTAAIIEAAQSRLRPILMTTLTTSLGLLPMAMGLGEGAEIRTPMAITVIYGLLFATLLTLFFIPVIYSLFDRKQFDQQSEQLPISTDVGETIYG